MGACASTQNETKYRPGSVQPVNNDGVLAEVDEKLVRVFVGSGAVGKLHFSSKELDRIASIAAHCIKWINLI